MGQDVYQNHCAVFLQICLVLSVMLLFFPPLLSKNSLLGSDNYYQNTGNKQKKCKKASTSGMEKFYNNLLKP